jgi:hypothetical protein
MTMNACVVVTANSMRLTVSCGGRAGIAIRVETVSPDLDMRLDLDSDLARELAGTLLALADKYDEDNE